MLQIVAYTKNAEVYGDALNSWKACVRRHNALSCTYGSWGFVWPFGCLGGTIGIRPLATEAHLATS